MKNLGFAEEVVNYDAPQVEVIEVEVEKGFAASLENGEGGGTTGGFGGLYKNPFVYHLPLYRNSGRKFLSS